MYGECTPAPPLAASIDKSSTAGAGASSRRRVTGLLVDARQLTRGALAQLFGKVSRDLTIVACELTDGIGPSLDRIMAIDLLIVHIGTAAARDRQVLKTARQRFPQVPLVVVADTDEVSVVSDIAAAGVSAFITTQVCERVAIEAVRCVLAGGTYFPADLAFRIIATAKQRAGSELAQATIGPGWPADLLQANGSYTNEAMPEPELVAAKLTPREQDVVRCMSCGPCNKLIARQLNISDHTVKVHLRRIMQKLGCHNRTQVALLARQCGAPVALEGESHPVLN